MKRLLLVSLFLFSASLLAQPVIDFETVGNDWAWNLFSAGTGGSFDIVANPDPSGLNTSDSCAMFVIGADGDPWAGVWSSDFPDMTIDGSNCYVKALVYKNVTSRFNLKLEPPNVDHFDSNTVVNEWQELVFEYCADNGVTGATLTLIPDQEDGARTHSSICYVDFIRFEDVLPVELTSFTANWLNGDAQLNWTTATEINNQGFEIQRSVDGNSFATIGFVKGFGTTSEKRNYTYVDNTVNGSGSFSYRLKQIDFGGNFEYSEVINLGSYAPDKFLLEQNFPNPFNPTTSLSFSLPVKSNVEFAVYNLLGQKVVDIYNGALESGKYSFNFDAANLSSGVYVYTVNAHGVDGQTQVLSKKMTLMK